MGGLVGDCSRQKEEQVQRLFGARGGQEAKTKPGHTGPYGLGLLLGVGQGAPGRFSEILSMANG